MADEVIERPTGEARVDAILNHLKHKHGIHLPPELAPKEEEVSSEVDENGDPIEPKQEEEQHNY